MAIDVLVKKKKKRKKNGSRDLGMVTAEPGQKLERRRPSSIKLPLIDGRRMLG